MTIPVRNLSVGDSSRIVNSTYSLPTVEIGWTSRSAFFKGEGLQINIGLGKGDALNIFNNDLIDWTVK